MLCWPPVPRPQSKFDCGMSIWRVHSQGENKEIRKDTGRVMTETPLLGTQH